MSAKRYWQGAFFLPLLLPILALGLVWLNTGLQLPVDIENDVFTDALGFLIASLVYGGIPYAIFLAGVLLWTTNRPVGAIRRFTYVAPLVYLGPFLVHLYIYAVVKTKSPTGGLAVHEWPTVIGYFTMFTFGIGYAYVLLAHAGYYAGRWLNWIRPAN